MVLSTLALVFFVDLHMQGSRHLFHKTIYIFFKGYLKIKLQITINDNLLNSFNVLLTVILFLISFIFSNILILIYLSSHILWGYCLKIQIKQCSIIIIY